MVYSGDKGALEGPLVLAERFTIKIIIYRNIGKNDRLMDFRCVDFLEELIYSEARRYRC